MISAQELLIYRLNVVESSFISGKRAGNIAAVSETFKEKMKHVNTKLASLEKEIPAVGECTEMLQQLEPILLHKRIGLLQMAEKVEELLEKKSQLVVAIDDLMNIKELVGVINTDSFKGI